MATTEERVIWIIGDIHGMYDPLRMLMSYIDYPSVDKFIFLGDFIDHGPSSKAVLDLVMELGDRAVPLMGNHEFLLLQTLYDEAHRARYGERAWLENGGGMTMRSFGFYEYEDFAAGLEAKYIEFMKNLKFFHIETLPLFRSEMKLIITHAGIMPDIALEEQLAVNNYADFNRFLQTRNICVEDSFIWLRAAFLNGDPDHWKDHVVIHGHSPTSKLHYVLTTDPPEGEDQYRPYVRRHPKNDRVVSINIDTGAAYGHRLTALRVVTATPKNDSESYYKRTRLRVEQVTTSGGYYHTNPFRYETIQIG